MCGLRLKVDLAAGCVLLVFENQQGRYRFSSRITQVQTPIQISSKQSQQWQSLLLKNNQGWRLVDYDGISYPPESRLGSIPMQRDFTGVKLIDNQLSNHLRLLIRWLGWSLLGLHYEIFIY